MSRIPDRISRRHFIAAASAAAAATSLHPRNAVANARLQDQSNQSGPTSDSSPDDADEHAMTAATIAEAQKIAGLEFTPAEHETMLRGLRQSVEGYKRRRERALPNGLAPATVFDPRLPGMKIKSDDRPFVRVPNDPGPLPESVVDIAFAPVKSLAQWIRRGDLTSERLTRIYLDRLRTYGPKLECVITLTEDLAIKQARRADDEIVRGRYRGPLHGIPWGAKDLFDTAGIRTTYGAMPYKDRIPETDATVVRKLDEAGAVLVAKTTLGALAYGDIWFGGRTNNPFNLEQGSSGSSAGSTAGTVAGLFGFALGTETLGSIVSPCMRCGGTGLRPTFGRVARTGAMALCWSLDKVGPICRTVEDTLLVLNAIHGADAGDASSVDMPLSFDARESVEGLRVGYAPGWFEGRRATEVDRAALEAVESLGVEMVEIELPEMNINPLMTILNVEAAAAFEELTLTNRDDELVWQEPRAWPNSFRESWFAPAIEYVQAQRIRRELCEKMAELFEPIDAIIGPSYAGGMLLITNNTGHPSLTLRAGFRSNHRPHGITIWGKLFDEGTIGRLGIALENKLGVWDVRPSLD